MGRGIGEDVERERVQAVAGEHRLGLAESLVHRRLAAAQIGIVHARQIVVDQRIDVDRLDRAADAQRSIAVDREQSRSGDGEQRPKPLAAADRGMAHRLEQALAAVPGRGQSLAKKLSTSARTRRASASSSCASRSIGLNRHRRA